MYESRLRAEWLRNQKGNHITNNRFASTASIYKNRAYQFVLQHTKEDGAKLAKKRHLDQIEFCKKRRTQLERQIDRGVWENSYDFMDDLLVENEAKAQLQNVICHLDKLSNQCPEELWNQRISPLKPEFVASLAVLNYASRKTDEIFSIDAERCDCGRLYRFRCITHENVCTACKECHPVLVAAEDIQTDVLQQGKTTPSLCATTSASLVKTLKKQVVFKDTASSLTPAPTTTTKVTNSGKLGNFNTYRKYLMQFAPDACFIPPNVWKLLYESLASIHLLSSLRCKPVPVAKILKDNNLQMYISHSVRLAKLFNGDPVPVLEYDLIARLLQRWKEIHDVAILAPDIKGLPGVEMLTHVFLLSENRADLASAFTTHKTNNVSATQSQKFSQLIEKCSRTSKLQWKM